MSSGPSRRGPTLRPWTCSRIWATMSGLASVVMSPVSIWLEMAARTRRMILPERVLGLSGTMWTVFGLGILVVFLVVLIDETLWIAPNGLHDAWPGIADADVAGISRARLYFFSFFVPNHRINSERAGPGAAGLREI